MNKLQKGKCLRCGYEWIFRVEKPKRCPQCISPKWTVPKEKREGKKNG